MSLLVGRRMNAQLVTVGANAPISQARQLMEKNRIRHLPVVEGRGLIGIVTDRDVRVAEARGRGEAELLVADVMTQNVLTVGPDTMVDQAAMLMVDSKIGCLPVLNAEDEVVGIITDSDILNVFVEATGAGSGAARLEVLLPDRPGALAAVARTLGALEVNILSVLSAAGEEGGKVLVLRIATENLEQVLDQLDRQGVEVLSAEPGRG